MQIQREEAAVYMHDGFNDAAFSGYDDTAVYLV